MMTTKRPVNICFHGVGIPGRGVEPEERDFWISPEFFRDVLDAVVGRADVRLSFDDGNSSDVEIGLTELRQRNLTATFFPIASRIGRAGSLDRSALRTLSAEGMTIGTHGMWHKPWRGMTDEQLTEELVSARHLIAEQTGTVVDLAACPLGSYDRRILKTLRRLGYASVFTSDRARSPRDAWLQARFSVRKFDDLRGVIAVLDQNPSPLLVMTQSARVAVKRWR